MFGMNAGELFLLLAILVPPLIFIVLKQVRGKPSILPLE